MKYDVDLQEIDPIRRARNVYEEESFGWWKEMRKRMLGRGKEAKKKERGKGGNIRERIFIIYIIMLPIPRARAVCLEL